MKAVNDKALSHRLSYLLRHAPQSAGLTLDVGGWVPVADVLAALGVPLAQLERVVADSDKQRFSLSGGRIRANQGHSVAVELQLAAQLPPEILYHGTVGSALDSIRRSGLTRQQRHHVHLSPDADTARKVGERRGPPVILVVRAGHMARAGHLFYCSENGVWLADSVPSEFIQFP
ncbi:RNA 2'-phosphotransferase [Deinococcus alpinitundrae]|uniref:RNA 2'-phosphotransferase n=1 Tax=Deinococcus alpinitundrae TaxID=468913 RepID=UPI00137B62DB|nr:RNA 2'-phosphotransferase [Deinococcus alpinitundrae]